MEEAGEDNKPAPKNKLTSLTVSKVVSLMLEGFGPENDLSFSRHSKEHV